MGKIFASLFWRVGSRRAGRKNRKRRPGFPRPGIPFPGAQAGAGRAIRKDESRFVVRRRPLHEISGFIRRHPDGTASHRRPCHSATVCACGEPIARTGAMREIYSFFDIRSATPRFSPIRWNGRPESLTAMTITISSSRGASVTETCMASKWLNVHISSL